MIGTQLGPYEIIDIIGRGGMATVYRARQTNMDRFVAVKIIHKAVAAESTSLDRFQREARLIARLEHPHILPVYDYNGSHDPPYIVMRYLPTGTLKDILQRDRLKLNEAAFLLRQIAAALDYAHRQGVIHRDIKPSNIMVDAEGNAFLTDFGIARMIEGTEGLTASGIAVGTPNYMAPEQGMGMPVDGRADIYSLGVMLYEMVTGETPFQADTAMAVILKHINDPIPLASVKVPDMPSAIDDIIVQAMAKNPDDRYQSANELSDALAQALGSGVSATPRHLQALAAQTITELKVVRTEQKPTEKAQEPARHPIDPDAGTIADADSAPTPNPPRTPNRTPLFAGAAVVAIALIAVAILILLGGGGDDSDDETSQTAAAALAAAETADSQSTSEAQDTDQTATSSAIVLLPSTTTAAPPDTITVTAVPTEPVDIAITGLEPSSEADAIIIAIDSSSEAAISEYRLIVLDESAQQIAEYTHTPPPFDSLRIPLENLVPGKYTILVRAYAQDTTLLSESRPVSFVYSPPATPTLEPTDTALPTVTATPFPTDTDVPTAIPSSTDTPEPTATHTPQPTNTATSTLTATLTATATATNTPLPTHTPTDTPEPTTTNTPQPTATDTPSPTPIVISIQVNDISIDFAQDVIWLDITTQGEQLISEYRFDFVNTNTSLLQARFLIPAPLPQPVQIPADDLDGDVTVIIRAFDFQGRVISLQDAAGASIDRATVNFTYTRPTPTPRPVTATPIPSPTVLPTAIVYPTPTPVPVGALPFIEDMESDNALDGWDYNPTQWQIVTEGGNATLIGQSGLDSAMEILGREAPEWKRAGDEDLLIDMRVNLLYGDSIARLIFRYGDQGYYALEMLPGYASVRRGQPGAINRSGEQILRDWPGAILQSGRWYEVKLWSEGSRVFVYIDNILRMRVNDTGFALPGGGAILLQTLSTVSGQVGFDDIVIQRPELASEHFQGSSFPSAWESPSMRNIEIGSESDGNQYLRMTEGGTLTPAIPAYDNLLITCRLYSETGGFNVLLRESGAGRYRLVMDGGHMEIQHLNGQGDLLQSWTRTNYYARGGWFDFVVLMVGNRLTIYRQGEIIFEETIENAPPAGDVVFTTPRNYDILRVDDCLFTETKVSRTLDARFAFEVLDALDRRLIRDGLSDWYDFFERNRSTNVWWESNPGEYISDSQSEAHTSYYTITSADETLYRRFRREMDSTNHVFGNGNDTTAFRDSTDIYVHSWVRLPLEAPVGSVAWLGTRSLPSITGSSLNQYQIELEKTDTGTLLRARTNTANDKTIVYEAPIEATFDGWHQLVIVALDDQIAFFADGRFIAAIRDVEQLGGTFAYGVEKNTIANFDDVIIRDTSVNY